MPTVLPRIVVGTDLPGILHKYRGDLPGEEIDHQRTLAVGSERRRGGYAAGDGAPARPQRISSRRIKLPVALGAVRLAIDVGQVVPDAQQMRISLRLECRADLPVRVSRCVDAEIKLDSSQEALICGISGSLLFRQERK